MSVFVTPLGRKNAFSMTINECILYFSYDTLIGVSGRDVKNNPVRARIEKYVKNDGRTSLTTSNHITEHGIRDYPACDAEELAAVATRCLAAEVYHATPPSPFELEQEAETEAA